MSTTGFEDGPPVVTGAQIGDSGNAVHLFGAICAALYQRTHTGRGQRVQISMRGGILNLPREAARPAAPRARAAQGVPEQGVRRLRPALRQRLRRRAARLGGALQADDREGANAWLYVVIQPQVWEPLMNKIGRPELVEIPTPRPRRGCRAWRRSST